MFHKIPVELPEPSSPKLKHQSLLHAIEGGLYMDILSQSLPTLNKRKLIKKAQENKDEIKINLHKANQSWNDWKFQIHWNKLEWQNPKICHEQKNPFVCLLKKTFQI